jgi:hypothetical protein
VRYLLIISYRLAWNACYFIDVLNVVDFQTFMIIIWNICTFDVQQLARVLFRYFKENNGPTMLTQEVDKMVDHLIGHKKEKSVSTAA